MHCAVPVGWLEGITKVWRCVILLFRGLGLAHQASVLLLVKGLKNKEEYVFNTLSKSNELANATSNELANTTSLDKTP